MLGQSAVFIRDNPVAKHATSMQPFNVAQPIDNEEEFKSLWLNRLITCTFCIILLWLTSLQMSSLIVGNVVETPTTSEVYDVCRYTWDTGHAMKRSYEKCIERQSVIRFIDLDNADIAERERTIAVNKRNDAYITRYKYLVNNISSVVALQRSILSSWVTGGTSHKIDYRETCNGQERARVVSQLNDKTSTNEATITQSSIYTTSTNNRVYRLTSYVDDLNSYNYRYMLNKTEIIRMDLDAAMLEIGGSIPNLNATLDNILHTIDINNACLTLEGNRTCPYGTSFRDVYEQMREEVSTTIDVIKEYIATMEQIIALYEQRVKSAINSANSFYDSIQGARGLVVWLVKTANLFGSAADLCGKSSPDWCDFSKVRIFLSEHLLS